MARTSTPLAVCGAGKKAPGCQCDQAGAMATARRRLKHRSWPKIDHPTLDAPWCIPEHRGASQSTAVHPSSPWGPGQAPLHACMCVCARCLPTPCGVSWCPPLQPSYPSCSQTHPVTHLCPRRLRLPRKVPAAPGESSLLSLSLSLSINSTLSPLDWASTRGVRAHPVPARGQNATGTARISPRTKRHRHKSSCDDAAVTI